MWQAEQQEKDKFAAEWLRTGDSFKAAIAVTGVNDAGRALWLEKQLVLDDYVLRRKQELIQENGEEAYLPSKADIARKVLEAHETARSTDDRLKALRLYAEIMGHISKPDTNSNKGGSGIVAIPINDLDSKL